MSISDHPRIPGTCSDCGSPSANQFCALAEPSFSKLRAIRTRQFYARGSTIFMEGESAHGVYILCSGRAKLSTSSEDGKGIILRIAEAGEVLGMNSAFTNLPYEKTAVAIENCVVGFVRRTDFVSFVRNNHDAALLAIEQLSTNYHKAHLQICSLGLSTSAADKLGNLLLQWSETSANGGPVRINRGHTHSEIAEMIGASRETVTRLFGSFKERGLITFSKSELVIPDRDRLKAVVGSKYRNGNGRL